MCKQDGSILEQIKLAKSRLESGRDSHVRNMARSFYGFRIIENPLLPENEIAIVCGSEVYRALLAETEGNKPNQ